MKIHTASLFRPQAYSDQMTEFVSQVDQGNFVPLREHVLGLIDKLQHAWPVISPDFSIIPDTVATAGKEQKWALSIHQAGGLPDKSVVSQIETPTNSELGQWFLICLAEHVSPCPSSLVADWKIFYDVLYRIGWTQAECDLLVKGRPTSFLLKPQSGQESPWPLKASDAYWLWLQPMRARAGWMKHSEVLEFFDRLELMEKQIVNFNIRKLFDESSYSPAILPVKRASLAAGYKNTMEMLKVAAHARMGLLMSISLI